MKFSYQQIVDVESQLEVDQQEKPVSSASSRSIKLVVGLGLAAFVGSALLFNSASSVSSNVDAMNVVTASPLQVRPMASRQQSQRRQQSVRTAATSRPHFVQPFEALEDDRHEEETVFVSGSSSSSSSVFLRAGAFASGAIAVAAAVTLLAPGTAEAKFDREAKKASYLAPTTTQVAEAKTSVVKSTGGPKKFDKEAKKTIYLAKAAAGGPAPASKAAPKAAQKEAPKAAPKAAPKTANSAAPAAPAKKTTYKERTAAAKAEPSKPATPSKPEPTSTVKTGPKHFDREAKKAAYLKA